VAAAAARTEEEDEEALVGGREAGSRQRHAPTTVTVTVEDGVRAQAGSRHLISKHWPQRPWSEAEAEKRLIWELAMSLAV
jgi:hypothetical protein